MSSTVKLGRGVTVVGLCFVVLAIGVGGSLAPASQAVDRTATVVPSAAAVLAPIVKLAQPVPIKSDSEFDRARYEAFMNATLSDGTWLAGSWFDPATSSVVGAVAEGAPADVLAYARELIGPTGKLQTVKFSWNVLTRSAAGFFPGDVAVAVPDGISAVSVDAEGNRVVVRLNKVTDDARSVAARVGGAPAVVAQDAISFHTTSGPNQYKDRYPYTGGAAYNQNGDTSVFPGCTTAFSMQTTGGASLQVTAGHCLSTCANHCGSITSPASLTGAGTSWSNLLGSSTTYTNSICASTGSSCDRGSTKYGDIAAISVTGNEPYFWTNGPLSTSKAAVNTQETMAPAVSETVCVSGSLGGTICNFTVTDNFTSIPLNDGSILTPVVLASPTGGNCPVPGDSGGSVFKPVSGVNRAVGIHSSTGVNPTGACVREVFTSIYYAQRLYSANVVLH
jgi:hypothetical protein